MAKVYVIVGASLAGATAAITLREEGADGTITLIGAEREPPYERPPLSKAYLRGEVAFDKALVRPAAFYAEHGIETMFGTRATRIDAAARFVELEDRRRVPFDALLIATGGRNRRISIPGGDLDGIYSLRTVGTPIAFGPRSFPAVGSSSSAWGSSGRKSRRRFGRRGWMSSRSNRRRLRSSACSARRSAQRIAKLHRAHGVRTILEDTVAAFEGNRRVASVVTKGGVRLECDFVVAGSASNRTWTCSKAAASTSTTAWSSTSTARRTSPAFTPRVTSRITIIRSSAGRCAWSTGRMPSSRAPRPRATCSAAHAVREIHWFWSDQYEANLQYAGFHTSWEQLVVRPPGFGQLSGVLCQRRADRCRGRAQPREGPPACHAAHQGTAARQP